MTTTFISPICATTTLLGSLLVRNAIPKNVGAIKEEPAPAKAKAISDKRNPGILWLLETAEPASKKITNPIPPVRGTTRIRVRSEYFSSNLCTLNRSKIIAEIKTA